MLDHVDEVRQHGFSGIFVEMAHQAYRDVYRGAWYAQLDAARWLLFDAGNIACLLVQMDPAKFAAIARRYLPAALAACAAALTQNEADLLHEIVAGRDYDEGAAAKLREKMSGKVKG
jgi:hypothetical protein